MDKDATKLGFTLDQDDGDKDIRKGFNYNNDETSLKNNNGAVNKFIN